MIPIYWDRRGLVLNLPSLILIWNCFLPSQVRHCFRGAYLEATCRRRLIFLAIVEFLRFPVLIVPVILHTGMTDTSLQTRVLSAER